MKKTLKQSATAKYYDTVYKSWIGQPITDAELKIISKQVAPPAKILDVGSGTGRHFIPLHEQGFKVQGVESSKDMLKELYGKLPEAQITRGDFLRSKEISGNQDLIICMWNGLSQIALDNQSLKKFLLTSKNLLKDNGILFFSTGNAEDFEPQENDFVHEVVEGDLTYRLTWSLLSYNDETNLTTSQEIITVSNSREELLDFASNTIIQKHWRQNEIREIAQDLGLSGDVFKLRESEELYYLLKKA